MNKFELSCFEFKQKYGYNTPKQIEVLEQIKKEQEQKFLRWVKSKPSRKSYQSRGREWSTGDDHFDYDLDLCGQF